MVHNRTELLNLLIERFKYRSYLEIGVCDTAANYAQIRAAVKCGVDPDPRAGAPYVMTSDEFFATDARLWDLVFVDGDHRWMTVLRDTGHALDRLNPNGTVVMHDCLPVCEEYAQLVYDGDKPGNGTAWKAFAILRMSRPDLSMWLLEMPGEDGVGIVRHGQQSLFAPRDVTACPAFDGPDHDLTWAFFEQHRKELLRPVTAEEFEDVILPPLHTITETIA